MIKKFYYSERGIVHSIIEDMEAGSEKEQIEKAKAFLNAIKFVGNRKPFKDLEITSFDFYEEPSFSEFGNPDLIVIINKDIVLFIEAKLTTYIKASHRYLGHKTDREYYQGRMSSVNVQLSLKNRFWNAMHDSYLGQEKLEIKELKNRDFLFNGETARRLKSNFVVKNYIVDSGMYKCGSVYYIALTNDDLNSKPDEIMCGEYRPPLSNETWSNDKHRFGLLTYDALIKNNVVSVDENKGNFGFASKILDVKNYDSVKNSARPCDVIVKTKKLSESKYLKEDILSKYESRIKRLEGSYSIIEGNETIGKIFEYEDNLLVGVKETVPSENLGETDIRYSINGKLFRCIKIKESNVLTNPDLLREKIITLVNELCKYKLI